jgi:tRNA(Ile2) C34 agmatinyltransferase TiaS
MFDDTHDVCDECQTLQPIKGFKGFVCARCNAEYEAAKNGDLDLSNDPDSFFYEVPLV